MTTALKLGGSMWGIRNERWQARPTGFVTSTTQASSKEVPIKDDRTVDPRSRKLRPKVNAYTQYSVGTEKAWFARLLDPQQNAEVPTREQERFLRDIVVWSAYEAQTQASLQRITKLKEKVVGPQSFALLAPRGTRKATCIKLVC